ncbi:MAG: hypothetical protein ABIO88_02105 [Burkholderiaceae bacterium]
MLLGANEVRAQTASITALTGQSCAGTRYLSDLGCTANDFAVGLSFTQPAATAIQNCIAGEEITIDVISSISSGSPERYGVGIFIGEKGNDPSLNSTANTCSLGVFPTSPSPFYDNNADVCGDFHGSSTATLGVNQVKLLCAPAPGSNLVKIPYLVAWQQNSGSSCTAATLTAGAPSKCTSSSAASVTGVVTLGYVTITKATSPAGAADTFSFNATASPAATVTPASFSLSHGQSQRVTVPLSDAGAAGTRTLVIDEALTAGWGPGAVITCTNPTGGSAASYVTIDNVNRRVTAALTGTNFGALCTYTNTQNPPALTVTKTASQTPLVVGQSGQSYSITIAVANGPTTAAITLADTLPSGITTSGAITASGGTLSGCPAAGASSLAGCSIASGAVTGNIVITVPVTVAASAANPSANTATVTGGGDPSCPAGANCTSTVSTPVIDAVNDSTSGQPGQAGTFNVSSNDKFPASSVFTQTGTTCSPAGSMTTAGVASYTNPATAAATCTVTYSVCAPAPNASVCDTAVLTVTAGVAPLLTVTKTASQSPLVAAQAGQFYTITIAVTNGPTTAAITLSDAMPVGVTTSGAITATGGILSGCPGIGATNLTGCMIASPTAGPIVITVPVAVGPTAPTTLVNSATVTGGGDPSCPAATHCTGTVTTALTRPDMQVVPRTELPQLLRMCHIQQGRQLVVSMRVLCLPQMLLVSSLISLRD